MLSHQMYYLPLGFVTCFYKCLCLYIEQQGFPLFTNYIAAYARLSLDFSDHTKKTQLPWREIG